jgi:anti-anti-sigma factor
MFTAGGLVATTERHGGTIVLSLAGELDLATVSLVRQELAQIERARPERIVIDLAELAFIDCTGMELIVEEVRRLTGASSPSLEIRPGSPSVQRAFQIARLDEVVPFGAPTRIDVE